MSWKRIPPRYLRAAQYLTNRPSAAGAGAGAAIFSTMKTLFNDNDTLEMARVRNVRDARYEDIGRGDWTAQLVAPGVLAPAQVTAKQPATLCGSAWFEACFEMLDTDARVDWYFADGDQVPKGAVVCSIASQARTSQRGAFGTEFRSDVVWGGYADTPVRAGDRGRLAQPQGVRAARHPQDLGWPAPSAEIRSPGGRRCHHRMALWDGILIKENHIKAAGSIAAALEAARALNSSTSIQVEVEDLDEMDQALRAGATSILLDDFTLGMMHQVVEINGGRALLEVSGGVDLDSVRAIAATGVDRISTGKLTKDISYRPVAAPALSINRLFCGGNFPRKETKHASSA